MAGLTRKLAPASNLLREPHEVHLQLWPELVHRYFDGLVYGPTVFQEPHAVPRNIEKLARLHLDFQQAASAKRVCYLDWALPSKEEFRLVRATPEHHLHRLRRQNPPL